MKSEIFVPKTIDVESVKLKSISFELSNVVVFSKKEALRELDRLSISRSYVNAIFIPIKIYGKTKFIKYPNSETVIALIHKVSFMESGEKNYHEWIRKNVKSKENG